jgi:hypothetical protein
MEQEMTGWRKRQVLEMARESGFNVEQGFLLRITGIHEDLERFAKLVREDEREKFLGALRQLHDSYSLASDSNGLKERGQA